MHLRHIVLPAALSMALSNPVFAAEDAARFLLTPTLIQPVSAVEPMFDNLTQGEQRLQSIEALVQAIDQDPAATTVVDQYALSSRELAYATVAMRQAALYVALEKRMEKQKRDALLASFTAEQKANIAVVRKLHGA